MLRASRTSLRAAYGTVRQSLRGGQTSVNPLLNRVPGMALSSSSGPHPSESFLNGGMSVYADEMHRLWRQDPSKVHSSWDSFFRNLEAGLPPGQAYQPAPGLQSSSNAAPVVAAPAAGSVGLHAPATNIVHLIRSYQIKGHHMANLDPLDLSNTKELPPDLDYRTFGFTDSDLDTKFEIDGFSGITGYIGTKGKVTLRQLIQDLQASYCGTIGVEYMHIPDREKCNFIRERFEIPNAASKRLSKDEKLQCLERITFAEQFETFLANKWNTAKRFGLEGCESLIPGMKTLVDRSTELGVESIVIGMPHRGRLNVLSNVVRKPLEVIFSEFAGTNIKPDVFYKELSESYSQSGDVKYHMGTSFDRRYPDGRNVHLSLVANPSHLEAVDPVVIGKTRAKQFYNDDDEGSTVLPILMHGDAAFCGQGVVYETMHLENLPNYGVGGTIHIVVNNQIGFTTNSSNSRATRYATDLGKAFNSPVFHINADDPEATAYVFKMAAEYRQKYRSNVIIDIVGYRRYGHNEMDNPMFTQPVMYHKIKNHRTVMELYQNRCISEGLCDQAHVDNVNAKVHQELENAYDISKTMDPAEEEWLDSHWKGFKSAKQQSTIRPTGVPMDVLQEIGAKVFTPPEGFQPHRTIKRLVDQKRKMLEKGAGIDWGAAEQLAFGSLAKEGYHVRLSGQDAQRGTFSHRHAILHDQNDDTEWSGLQNVSDDQAEVHVFNSSLSEYGVMGYELGYSLENPNALVMWEGQFGDFVNGAQIIIDQFLSCGEQKWLRQSGLVLLLPHGYDGSGPEHSSCRIERFLTLSDEDPDVVPDMDEESRMQIQRSNWQVVNCTTPAQIFHVLRRQMHREFRKPLIVAAPKNLLKHKDCTSDLEEFSPGTMFQRLLPEQRPNITAKDPKSIKKLIFCVGKIYYELDKAREEMGEAGEEIAIVRIEQITPFPFDLVAEQVNLYSEAEMVFVQEEPKNMGTWYFIDDRIYTATRVLCGEGRRCEYVGRKTMASPAVGYGSVHQREQDGIIAKALGLQ